MSLIVFMIVLVAVALLVVLAFVMILWAAHRWLGAKWELGLSLVVLAYLIYDWVRLDRFCSADPTYIAPTEAEAAAGSEGMMIFNCDAPGGMLDYFYLQMLGPGLIVITVILAFRALLYLRKLNIAKGAGAV